MSSSASPAPLAAPIIQPLLNEKMIAGAVVLFADRDGVRDIEALGYADLATKRPMDEDTFFWIASTSKAISGTAVMMAIESGAIDPNAPVESYLPEFKGQMVTTEQDGDHILLRKPAHPITVRETLCHTSGLQFRSPITEFRAVDELPLEMAVRTHAASALLFEPGTKYSYSNAGTNTAARLVEVTTGQRFEDFLQERLFDPLGMTETTFWPSEAQVTRLATPYKVSGTDEAPGELETFAGDHFRPPLNDRTRRFPVPAGGLFSVARDVAQFGRMIANLGTLDGRRYLTEESVREMTAKQTAPEVPEKYGYGWQCGDGFWGHGGAYGNQFVVDPSTGVVFVFMVQMAGACGPRKHAVITACRDAGFKRFAR